MNKITTRQDCAQLKAKGSAQVEEDKKLLAGLSGEESYHTFEMPFQFAFPSYASFKADTTFWQEIKSKSFLHR